jgi:hypothetical protein
MYRKCKQALFWLFSLSLSLSLSLWTGGNTYFSYLRIYVLLSPFAIIAHCNHNPVLDADEKNCKANTDPKTEITSGCEIDGKHNNL